MAKSIKSLLKKGKLTGAEVGRLMIADLVAAYKNAMKGKTDGFGLFTPEEKQRLSDAVTGTQDIRDYNDYIAIYNFLKTYGAICQSMATSVELEFFRLYSLLSRMLEAETSYSLREIAPTIMTEKEYADKIQTKIDEYCKSELTAEHIITHAAEYFAKKYEDGEETPFNQIFEEYKQRPIANESIRSGYWAEGTNAYYVFPDGTDSRDIEEGFAAKMQPFMEEARKNAELSDYDMGKVLKAIDDESDATDSYILPLLKTKAFAGFKRVDDRSAPEGTTLYDVVKGASCFYWSEEAEGRVKDPFFEFMTDFPEFYKALVEHLASLPGLSSLKSMKKRDLVSKHAFKVKELYDNDVLDYRQIGNSRETLDGCMGGVAVLQAHIFYPQSRVDENGWYIKDDAAVRFMKKNMAEAVLESFSETIANSLDSIKVAATAYYSHAAAIALAGDIVGVEMTAPLLYPFPTDKIEGLNWLMGQAHDRPMRYEIKDIDARVAYEDSLYEQLKETFAPIDLEALKPDKDKLAKVRKELTPASFRNLNLNELLAAG